MLPLVHSPAKQRIAGFRDIASEYTPSPVSPPEVQDAMIGATIAGRYVVQARIGVGGMAVVYRAQQLAVDRPVAVKVLHPGREPDAASVEGLCAEARAMGRIRHANVVTIYDFGVSDDGLPFIAMELIEGETLARRISRGPLPLHEALGVAQQLAHALEGVHEAGFVHRDVKPHNVMLGPVGDRDPAGQETVRLLDFGIVDPIVAHPRPEDAPPILGTPEYCAPEQATGGRMDHRGDLYALGVILFEMLAGRCPFTSVSATRVLEMQVFSSPPRLSSVCAPDAVPHHVEALVAHLLAKSPDERPQTARAVSDALDDLYKLTPVPGIEPRGYSFAPHPPSTVKSSAVAGS